MKDRSANREAFERIFLDYFQPLTVYALQFVKDLEVSEDIVQDVFLYLYEKRESIQIHNQGSNYLYKLVRYRCLNYLEHRKIRIEKNTEIHLTMNSNPSQ